MVALADARASDLLKSGNALGSKLGPS